MNHHWLCPGLYSVLMSYTDLRFGCIVHLTLLFGGGGAALLQSGVSWRNDNSLAATAKSSNSRCL